MRESLLVMLLAVDKHKIAGIAVIVVGAIVAVLGIVRAVRRESGAVLVALAGAAVAVIGVLLFSHTIHG